MDFDDRSGTINCRTEWGEWYQTVEEAVIFVHLETGTRGKDLEIGLKPQWVFCKVKGKTIFEGKPFEKIREDESLWTIEDKKLLRIVLAKAEHRVKDTCWSGLLYSKDNQLLYKPDKFAFNDMRKKLDLERFQIENPGMDFSNAKLDKRYEEKSLKKADEALETNQPY